MTDNLKKFAQLVSENKELKARLNAMDPNDEAGAKAAVIALAAENGSSRSNIQTSWKP